MSGETNLQTLLRSMTPELDDVPYGIVVAKSGVNIEAEKIFATMRETEGVTLIAVATELKRSGYVVESEWARITLQIHSSLQAVGLTAAFATALGKSGISANVVAGYHHDHIFVQWDKRHSAMSALAALSKNS
jgi:uncharacterized protein